MIILSAMATANRGQDNSIFHFVTKMTSPTMRALAIRIKVRTVDLERSRRV